MLLVPDCLGRVWVTENKVEPLHWVSIPNVHIYIKYLTSVYGSLVFVGVDTLGMKGGRPAVE